MSFKSSTQRRKEDVIYILHFYIKTQLRAKMRNQQKIEKDFVDIFEESDIIGT